MFKLTWRGVVPIEETEFNWSPSKEARTNKEPKNFAEELSLDGSDFWAIYLAAMQTFFPIMIFFAAAYYLAILFVTKVWFV